MSDQRSGIGWLGSWNIRQEAGVLETSVNEGEWEPEWSM